MREVLGLPVSEALELCKALNRPVRTVETGGYKQDQDISGFTDLRVIGVREEAEGILLITARF